MSRSRILRLESLDQFQAIQVLSDPGAIGGPVVIPFAVQIVINWTLPGAKTAHNVLYGRAATTPAPTVAQAQAIFAALTSGAAWTALAGRLSNTVTLASVTLTSVHTAGLPSFTSTGAAVPGASAGIALPNEVAVCVTLRTSLRGAQNRGRMFITGWDTAQNVAGGVMAAGTQNDTGTWANGIKAILAAQSYTWAIGQRARSEYIGTTGTVHPARPANVNVDIQTALVRDNRWDSQRRRGLD